MSNIMLNTFHTSIKVMTGTNCNDIHHKNIELYVHNRHFTKAKIGHARKLELLLLPHFKHQKEHPIQQGKN